MARARYLISAIYGYMLFLASTFIVCQQPKGYIRIEGSSFGYSYASMWARTPTECCVRCFEDALCVSVNFAPLDRTCDLNRKSPVDTTRFASVASDPERDLYYQEVEPCVPPWLQFDRHCYLVDTTSRTFADSSAYCRSQGAELVDIKHAPENEFVRDIAVEAGVLSAGLGVWIGLEDYHINDPPMWTSGTEIVYTNFSVGEPNNVDNVEQCIEIGHTGGWNDKVCDSTWAGVCKMKLY